MDEQHPVSLTLGEHYRLRNGTKVGPLEANAMFGYPWKANSLTWTADGRFRKDMIDPHDLDIVKACRVLAREKLMCDVTLDDYRRGVARIWRGQSYG